MYSSILVAEDISEYNIEGISLGDSLLDHYNMEEISNAYKYDYENVPYTYYVLFPKNPNSIYERIQITIKRDNKYIDNLKNKMLIHEVAGQDYSFENIDACYFKLDNIKNELVSILNSEAVEDSGYSSWDQTGESKYKRYRFYLNENNLYADIILRCTDIGETWEKEGYQDVLSVSMYTKEYIKEINTNAY